MTDLRDALKRASGISDNAEPNHTRIGERAGRIVRRRRIAYSALSVIAIAVVGFSAFQIAGGDETKLPEQRGGVATRPSPPPSGIQLLIQPKSPLQGDTIKITLQNTSDRKIYFGTQYTVERRVERRWKNLTSKLAWTLPLLVLDPGDREKPVELGLNPGESWLPGEYRVTKSVSFNESLKREFEVTRSFTVLPAPPSAAPIEVAAPDEGEEVDSPVTVRGTADVYEGTVSIRIRDEDGEVIAEAFTTATCGSGCRGRFSTPVEFQVDREQRGTIEVYSESAETGEPMHLVEIPVTLRPSEGQSQGSDQRAAIEVDSPQPNDAVVSPVTVAGTANVYEATVSIRIRDENGNVLVETFTTASCGSGCRGDYTKRVRFDVEVPTNATIEVYSVSAENGEDMFLVEIPVILMPPEG